MSARLPVVASSCSGDRISRDATAGVGAAVPPFSLVDLQRRRVRYGIVTMCVGGGQGAAALFERA